MVVEIAIVVIVVVVVVVLVEIFGDSGHVWCLVVPARLGHSW